jgi:hypothetical protein
MVVRNLVHDVGVENPLNWMNDVALPREWAEDMRLSFSARGVLAELVATPPEGEMSVERLVEAAAGETAETVEAHLHELERLGYLIREGECWYLCDPHPLV